LYPDLRGNGRTVSDSLDWDMPQIADDIIFMMDELGIDKCHIVGFSLGGYIAFYCAIKHPSRIKSFVSIGADAAYNRIDKEKAKDYEPDNLVRNGYAKWIELIEVNHYEAHKGDWQYFVKRTMYNWNKYCYISDKDLQQISIPCMVIVGEKDNRIFEENLARLEALIKALRIERVKRCGHGPHVIFDKPLETNELIIEFLKGIEN
jgi:pimeloyl-ACP methyl ester carboxylesterase